jgi:serine protease SohB
MADAVGDLRTTLRARFGDKVMMPLVAPERSFLGRPRPGIATDGLDGLLGRVDFAEDIVSAFESRMMWARYGL